MGGAWCGSTVRVVRSRTGGTSAKAGAARPSTSAAAVNESAVVFACRIRSDDSRIRVEFVSKHMRAHRLAMPSSASAVRKPAEHLHGASGRSHSRHRCIERPTAPGAPRTSMHRTLTCPWGTSDLDASNLDLPLGHLGPRWIEAMGWPRSRSGLDASLSDVPAGQVEARYIDVRGAPGAPIASMHRCRECPGGSRTLDASLSRVPRGQSLLGRPCLEDGYQLANAAPDMCESGKITKPLPRPLAPKIDDAHGGIRTCDLWLRRPTLYPAELRARSRQI
jgi:hypothetical protein